ncbi:hypothetical protein ElyMa_001574200 [Elysia marginata]|uniref:G-protein coupled receptors family 1 profile domain-containing protein n=1 Tax=Elysia marginata TaxID=1093978 RepID=A0AAV4JDY8_9GAST|nr:hypothetical protein ElyMa_001574200 [Elysia marginata]
MASSAAAAAATVTRMLHNYSAALSMREQQAEPDVAVEEFEVGVSPLLPNVTLPDYSQMDFPSALNYKPVWEMGLKIFFYVLSIALALVGNIIVIVVVAKNARMHVSCCSFRFRCLVV